MVIIVSISKIKVGNNVYNLKDDAARKSIDTINDDLNTIKTKIEGLGNIISGMIMLWSGSSDNIPDGWVLCNGENGTPDLTDKFVIGAGGTYNSGDTGGESAHVLTIDEMPKHSHKMKYDSIGWTAIRQSSGTNGIVENTTSSYDGQYSTEEVGNGNRHNNMPPYYALCFIMKS